MLFFTLLFFALKYHRKCTGLIDLVGETNENREVVTNE